jgi:ATP-dependent Clp protease protease subunit
MGKQKAKKFWSWVRNEDTKERTLHLEGVIAEDSWFGDEATPKAFKHELYSGNGDITVWINSPGGCVFAAAQIYNMLKEYNGRITVKIDSLAASAASVVAMAGDEVCMSPVAMLMIHNPATFAWGDSDEMRRAQDMLDEVKQSIINAYEAKTGMSRVKLAHMMDDETWMNAKKALELGFINTIMYADAKSEDDSKGFVFSRTHVTNCLLNKFQIAKPKGDNQKAPTGTPIESLDKRLSLLFR